MGLKEILSWSKNGWWNLHLKKLSTFEQQKLNHHQIKIIKIMERNHKSHSTTHPFLDPHHIVYSESLFRTIYGSINTQKKSTKNYKRLFLFKRFLYYKPKLEIKIRMVLADSFILSQSRAFLFIWFPNNYYSKIKTIFNEVMKVTL